MNAKQKESVLYTNGYNHSFDVTGYSSVKLHMWTIDGYTISESESKAAATHAAYQHYLANQAPTETQTSETPSAPQMETRFIVGKRSNEYCWYVWDNEDNEEASGNYWSVDEAQARANELNANGPSRVVVDEKDERIAELEAELQAIQDQLTTATRDALNWKAQAEKAEADNAALRNENARMKEAIMKVLRNIRLDEQDALDDLAAIFTIVNGKDTNPTPPAQEAPKRPVATHCRVNWNGRGFSTGSYEVLGYSQDKQVYVLNISSDADKPVPKTVKMADCAVLS